MRTLFTLASILALTAAPALAGEGQVSKRSLANMGLPGMKALSDDQGMAIRGQSIAIAISHSHVNGGITIPLVNNPIGTHFAASATISFNLSGTFAGGFATASAH